jgi:hypothetical protein
VTRIDTPTRNPPTPTIASARIQRLEPNVSGVTAADGM